MMLHNLKQNEIDMNLRSSLKYAFFRVRYVNSLDSFTETQKKILINNGIE